MTALNQRILCIDDDNDTCELIKFVFEQTNFQITTCRTPNEGLQNARRDGFGAIILDNRFAGTTGIDICREIRRFDAKTPIVLFSADARPSEKEKAYTAGANSYLVKPNDFEKLTETVISLIENRNTRQ
jgi:two-component system phosphate regulon response regulator PhoB